MISGSQAGRPSFFPNAQSPTINGGVIAAVQGNAYFGGSRPPSLSERQGMKILVDHIASGAFHDAAERGDPPKCHKDTRKSIIARIMKWRLKEHNCYNSVMWLSGPAGAGKSAIMQTIAEMCVLEQILGGSFFFARSAPERNNPSRFIATLAYQIVQAFPEIQERVINAIEADQAIFTRNLTTQVQVLIVQPLNEMARTASGSNILAVENKKENESGTSQAPKFFLIDALDECLTGAAQRSILDSITSILRDVTLPIPPFIFLISSRPEYEIRQIFDIESSNFILSGPTHIKLQPDYDADLDIEVFLQSTFQKIKDTHPIRSQLPLEWPTAQQMQYLLYMSSSQFIYAATAIKYIDSPRHNPFIRLNAILTPGSTKGKDAPFSQLDNLYRLILGAVADIPMVLEILTFLILRSSKKTWPTIEFASALFGFDEGDVRLALTDMYALMNVPALNDDRVDVLRIHHASMIDFLTDASRSGEFYIDSEKGHTHLTVSFIRCMMRIQERSVADSPLLVGMIAGFTEHYPRSHLTDELKYALDNFGIDKLMANVTPEQFYNTDWNALFATLKKKEYSEEVIYDRILFHFDVGIRDKLRQYPEIIQTCIPAAYSIFPQHYLNSTVSIFSIIMARRPDVRDVKLLDNTLFQFQDQDTFEALAAFFGSHTRAGTYFPTEANFKALAKEIVENMCPVKREGRTLCVHLYASYWTPPYSLPYDGEDIGVISLHDRFYYFEFFEEILAKCPNDLELAVFLRDRVLQLPKHASIDRVFRSRENIGKFGLQYIKNCGVSYKDHIHIQDLNLCLICVETSDPEPTDEGVLAPEDIELLEMPVVDTGSGGNG